MDIPVLFQSHDADRSTVLLEFDVDVGINIMQFYFRVMTLT
jgi:hypothetical protein